MYEIPPEYSQTHRELQDAIDNPVQLSDTELKAKLDGLAHSLTDKDANAALTDEIKELSQHALSIDESFTHVANTFRKLGDESTLPKLKADVEGLRTMWLGHQKTYTDLLWQSRSVAGKAQAAADDFAKEFVAFLADDNVSLDEKKTEIRHYIEKLDRDGEASEDMARGFLALRNKILLFRAEWEAVVDTYDLDVLTARIGELDKAIGILEMTLADLEKKVEELCLSLKVSTTMDSVTGLLSVISPKFTTSRLFGTLGGGVSRDTLDNAIKERNTIFTDLKTKKEDRETAMADPKLKAGQQLEASLAQSQGDLVTICGKLSGFAKVWSIIRADLLAIQMKLEFGDGSGHPELLKARLNAAAKLYEVLGKALYQYQRVVGSDHVIFASILATIH